MRTLTLLTSALLALPLAAQEPASAPFEVPKIPYEKYTLPNGLTVLLSRDTTAPVTTVNVWYHVGSKNEAPGRTGFAHLFEHVMFQGSQHIPYGQHFKVIETGGGDVNGTTNNDRTNYFETMPSNHLETMLWLESDRMGFLLEGLDITKLDAQRDVVKNERRQRYDNQPYGTAFEALSAALWPADNPYSWSVIGSMADLTAATLDDVKGFFKQYYAPNNATLAVVGDIEIESTKRLIEKYFGAIPRGPDIVRPKINVVPLAADKRLVLQDTRSQLPQLQIAWVAPGADNPVSGALSFVGRVLTQDRTSRLTKLLVYDRQLASRVSANLYDFENAGIFFISVTPRPDASLTEIERLVDSTLAGVLGSAPPTQQEIDRVKNYLRVNSVIGLDGSMNKAERLLEGQTFHNDPLYYVTETNRALNMTAAQVTEAAKQYLTKGRIVMSMIPAGKVEHAARPDLPYTDVTPEGQRRAPQAENAPASAGEGK